MTREYLVLLTVTGVLGIYLARGLRPVNLGPQRGNGPPYAPNVKRPGFYFSWDEMIRTDTGLQNTPGGSSGTNLVALVAYVLDPLRASIGQPVHVKSGYRSQAVNDLVGGSDASAHTTGQAADITAGGLSSRELASLVVQAGLPFDQLIWYAPERGGHLHVSYTGNNRRQTLFADSSGAYIQASPVIS